MILINLVYCCKKVFIHINTWMIEKNSMKLYYLKKMMQEDIADAGYAHAKRVCKDFEINNQVICMFKTIHYC